MSKQLTLDALRSTGGFASAKLEKRTIKYTGDDGESYEFDVYVKPLSYASVISSMRAKDGGADRVAAQNISASICDQDGNPIFTPEVITGESDPEQGPLSAELTMALLGVIGEVSKGKKLAKQASSPKKKSSGTS